jgi:hypothetical protein
LCQKCANQTKEHIQSLKKSLIGLKRSEECKKHIRENNWMRGKIGDKSPVWNFNKTDLERKIKHAISGIGFWKTFIKQKYNYQCQNPKCNHVGKLNDGSIHVHHLNNFHIFKEQRTDIDNGIVLCIKCHKLLHKIYGKYTTNEHFNKFIQEY